MIYLVLYLQLILPKPSANQKKEKKNISLGHAYCCGDDDDDGDCLQFRNDTT